MFSTSLVQSCTKIGKAMKGSDGQKWPSKLATNFEKGDRDRSLTIFINDCSYQPLSQSPNYLESSTYCMWIWKWQFEILTLKIWIIWWAIKYWNRKLNYLSSYHYFASSFGLKRNTVENGWLLFLENSSHERISFVKILEKWSR